MFRSCAVLAVALLALAGCSRVEAAMGKPALATPSLPCLLPYGTHVALLSPAPGSTGVGDRNSVVLAATRDLPKTVTVVATDAKGIAGPAATLERTARPAHAAPLAFRDPVLVYYRASGVGLQAHRRYTLALDDLAQNGCAPLVQLAGNAHFST